MIRILDLEMSNLSLERSNVITRLDIRNALQKLYYYILNAFKSVY